MQNISPLGMNDVREENHAPGLPPQYLLKYRMVTLCKLLI